MTGLNRLCESVELELAKIAEKPLTSTSLENAYKLTDIMKDIKTIEAMEDSYNGGNYANNADSYGRHYVRGHYSREGNNMNSYAQYMDNKNSYRYSQSQASHDKMIDSLSAYMRDVTARLEDMLRDSDTQEERNMIQRYISNIRAL